MKFVHVINPFRAEPPSDLCVAQPITFESMRRAKNFLVSHCDGQLEVDLVTTQYEEDHDILPHGFMHADDLNRSVLDFGEFSPSRKLPLIIDILKTGVAKAPEADWIIYTNVDIGLQPHFYMSVAALIEQGQRALIINRRTISADYQDPCQLPLIWGEVGQTHAGFDCFVFPAAVVDNLRLANLCVGAPGIGWALTVNLRILAGEQFTVLKDKHLTFHIGDDMVWTKQRYKGYAKFNRRELLDCISQLESIHGDLGQDPVVGKMTRKLLRRFDETTKRKSTWWFPFGTRKKETSEE